MNNVFSVFVKVDDELFENLEEALIMADIGVETSTYIIEKLRDNVKHKHITDGNLVKEELKSIISEILSTLDTPVDTVCYFGDWRKRCRKNNKYRKNRITL